jgi:Ca2+-binding RTX toxin-like protein
VAITASNRYNVQVRRPSRAVLALAAGLVFALPLLGGGARAAFFGQNGLVAYTCGSNVCVVAPGTSGTTLIDNASDPVWSPNGSKLAYVTSAGAIDVATVVNGALSGSAIQIAAAPAAQPTWSGNGLLIAYVNMTDNNVHVSNADGSGTNPSPVLATAGASEPAWAPNGTELAFVRAVSGHDEIFAVTLGSDGIAVGSEVQLTSSTVGDRGHPSWSPDSSSIVYTSTQENAAGPPLLFTMTASGASQTKLGGSSGISGQSPSYSPDTTELVYAVPAGATGAGTLQTIAATGAGSPTTIDSGTSDADPDWQATTFVGGGGTGPPVNVSYPTVVLGFGSDSAPTVGRIVSATVGSWTGSFPISYAFQWKKCEAADPINGPCYAIPGATRSVLVVTPDLYGWRVRVAVTATNSLGSTSQNSESSGIATASAPFDRNSPPITGAHVVDQPITAGPGLWDGSPPITFAYQWKRCDPFGNPDSCMPIPGATQSTYTPTTEDIGAALRVYVTATNFVGSATQFSNHTFPIVDKQHFAPSSLSDPEIAGTTTIGRQLTADIGTFGGDTPIDTSFVWERCDATGSACHVIASARKVVYFPTIADAGSTLRLAVTATNAYGKVVALSQPTEPIMAEPPHRKGRRIVGTQKSDYLGGSGWDDTIIGLGGNDTLLGGNGDDRIWGGAGNDVIVGGAGADHLSGGPGSDTIYAQDGERDIVDCGPGNDRAVVDDVDVVRKNCEVVVRGSAAPGGTGTVPGGTGAAPGGTG